MGLRVSTAYARSFPCTVTLLAGAFGPPVTGCGGTDGLGERVSTVARSNGVERETSGIEVIDASLEVYGRVEDTKLRGPGPARCVRQWPGAD